MDSRFKFDEHPLPPPLVLPPDTIYKESNSSKSIVVPPKPSKKAPPPPNSINDEDLLNTVKEHDDKLYQEIQTLHSFKSQYVEAVSSTLKAKESQLEDLMRYMLENMMGVVKKMKLPQKVQMDMLKQEKLKIEKVKALLFDSAESKSLDILDDHIHEKMKNVVHIDHVRKIQAYIKMRKTKRAYGSQLKILKHRGKVIKEILDSERTYIDSLERIIEIIYKPTKQRIDEGVTDITSDDLKLLFSDIHSILTVNKELLKDLEKAVQVNRLSIACLGKVFVTFAPYFRSYKLFLVNFDNINSTLTKYNTKDSLFNAYLNEINYSSHLKGQSLQSLLIMPIQRLPRYEMLLKSLISYTQKDHPDYEPLNNALVLIEEIVNIVNNYKYIGEAQNKIFIIQQLLGSKCPKDFVQPHRILMKDGNLDLKTDSIGPCQVYLFSDSLLVAQKIGINQLKLLHFLPLDMSYVDTIDDNSSSMFTFISQYPKQIELLFQAENERECANWISSIESANNGSMKMFSPKLPLRKTNSTDPQNVEISSSQCQPKYISPDEEKELIKLEVVYNDGPMCDLLWSDPTDEYDGWGSSPRGAGYQFGKEPVERWNKTNDLSLIVRAHQLVFEGYKYSFDEQLVTVWSAPNYCYRCGNIAAILEINENLERSFIKFDASPTLRDETQFGNAPIEYFL